MNYSNQRYPAIHLKNCDACCHVASHEAIMDISVAYQGVDSTRPDIIASFGIKRTLPVFLLPISTAIPESPERSSTWAPMNSTGK